MKSIEERRAELQAVLEKDSLASMLETILDREIQKGCDFAKFPYSLLTQNQIDRVGALKRKYQAAGYTVTEGYDYFTIALYKEN